LRGPAAGLLDRGPGSEAAEEGVRRYAARSARRRVDTERRPRLVVEREGEALRHDADDGRLLRTEPNDPPDHGGVRREAALPHAEAEHDHGGRLALRVALNQKPSVQGQEGR
jgi:hypothetical protein